MVEIWIENNSNFAKVVEFSTYMDDSLVDRRKVIREDSVADLIRSFRVNLPVSRSVRFRFVADSCGRETECVVNPDSISREAFVNVVFMDRTLRGGLGPDSVLVDTSFGCKVYYHGLKPE